MYLNERFFFLFLFLDEMEADSIPASQISKSIYSNDSINEMNNSVQNINNIAVDEIIKEQNSSEDNESKKVSRIKINNFTHT